MCLFHDKFSYLTASLALRCFTLSSQMFNAFTATRLHNVATHLPRKLSPIMSRNSSHRRFVCTRTSMHVELLLLSTRGHVVNCRFCRSQSHNLLFPWAYFSLYRTRTTIPWRLPLLSTVWTCSSPSTKTPCCHLTLLTMP